MRVRSSFCVCFCQISSWYDTCWSGAGRLPAGEAHAKCPPHQADLAVTSISRCAFKVAPFCTFGTFAPGLPDGIDETPHNDAGSMASTSTVPCCSSIPSPAPSRGGESANGQRWQFARLGKDMNLVLSSSLSKAWMLIGRSSSRAPPSPSSFAVSRRSEPRISSCSASRQTKASFGCVFSPCKLNRAKPLVGGAVWKLSPGPADHRCRHDRTGHRWIRINDIILQHGSWAMISDLASALSAKRTDHFRSASEAGLLPAHSAAVQRIRRMASGIARALRLHE
ncbi:hypothetical protein ACVWY3_004728 [Bradyrhizobium sp. USDA 4486]